MTVIAFQQSSYVEIDGGVVTSATITDANGTRPDHSEIGKYRFFVDVVEADGGRIGMWAGNSHADAVREANVLSTHFGSVRDRTIGGCQ